ncbi:MAG: hypothetical protein H6832_03135 [Planctomycetes bacterium]|nr:hypothetical protein [Planctomycetota bacterium]
MGCLQPIARLRSFFLGWFCASWTYEKAPHERAQSEAESRPVADLVRAEPATQHVEDAADVRVEKPITPASDERAQPTTTPDAAPKPTGIRKSILGHLWRAGMKVRLDATLPAEKWDELDRELDRLWAIHEDLQRRRNEMAFAYFR